MASFGITIVSPSGGIVESADIEEKSEFKQLIDSTGHHSQAKAFDVTFTVNVRGRGDASPYAVGTSGSIPTLASGKGIWTSVKLSSKNDDFRSWEASATVYKYAT
jgi:hypothetical protein